MVLRKKPSGDLLPSAHQIEREFFIMKFLHSKAFPVPKPFALVEDPSVIGTSFFLMEFIEGTIFKFYSSNQLKETTFRRCNTITED